MFNIKEIIEKMMQQLKRVSETPRLDSELLIAAVLKQDRVTLFAHSEKTLSSEEEKNLKKLMAKRLNGEPVAYILGHKEFWDLDLKVNADVLIPRPETELLVEWTLNYLPALEKLNIADLGTGSGAIALALGMERAHWKIDATDYSKKALTIAKYNANQHNIKNVKFYLEKNEGEWCQALPHHEYHAILGNPPYIAENDAHLANLKFEPRKALAAGLDGLDAIRKIIFEAREYLLPNGWLSLEHGYNQRGAIIDLMEEAGYLEIRDRDDLSGLPRMIVGRK